jgi:hypothetical protein
MHLVNILLNNYLLSKSSAYCFLNQLMQTPGRKPPPPKNYGLTPPKPRPKAGFSRPIAPWANQALRGLMRESITHPAPRGGFGFVALAVAKKEVPRSGARNASSAFRALLRGIWLRAFGGLL